MSTPRGRPRTLGPPPPRGRGGIAQSRPQPAQFLEDSDDESQKTSRPSPSVRGAPTRGRGNPVSRGRGGSLTSQSSVPASSSPSIPPGYIKYDDPKNGKTYYYPEGESMRNLEVVYQEHLDPKSNRKFFINVSTKKTTWKLPPLENSNQSKETTSSVQNSGSKSVNQSKEITSSVQNSGSKSVNQSIKPPIPNTDEKTDKNPTFIQENTVEQSNLNSSIKEIAEVKIAESNSCVEKSNIDSEHKSLEEVTKIDENLAENIKVDDEKKISEFVDSSTIIKEENLEPKNEPVKESQESFDPSRDNLIESQDPLPTTLQPVVELKEITNTTKPIKSKKNVKQSLPIVDKDLAISELYSKFDSEIFTFIGCGIVFSCFGVLTTVDFPGNSEPIKYHVIISRDWTGSYFLLIVRGNGENFDQNFKIVQPFAITRKPCFVSKIEFFNQNDTLTVEIDIGSTILTGLEFSYDDVCRLSTLFSIISVEMSLDSAETGNNHVSRSIQWCRHLIDHELSLSSSILKECDVAVPSKLIDLAQIRRNFLNIFDSTDSGKFSKFPTDKLILIAFIRKGSKLYLTDDGTLPFFSVDVELFSDFECTLVDDFEYLVDNFHSEVNFDPLNFPFRYHLFDTINHFLDKFELSSFQSEISVFDRIIDCFPPSKMIAFGLVVDDVISRHSTGKWVEIDNFDHLLCRRYFSFKKSSRFFEIDQHKTIKNDRLISSLKYWSFNHFFEPISPGFYLGSLLFASDFDCLSVLIDCKNRDCFPMVKISESLPSEKELNWLKQVNQKIQNNQIFDLDDVTVRNFQHNFAKAVQELQSICFNFSLSNFNSSLRIPLNHSRTAQLVVFNQIVTSFHTKSRDLFVPIKSLQSRFSLSFFRCQFSPFSAFISDCFTSLAQNLNSDDVSPSIKFYEPIIPSGFEVFEQVIEPNFLPQVEHFDFPYSDTILPKLLNIETNNYQFCNSIVFEMIDQSIFEVTLVQDILTVENVIFDLIEVIDLMDLMLSELEIINVDINYSDFLEEKSSGITMFVNDCLDISNPITSFYDPYSEFIIFCSNQFNDLFDGFLETLELIDCLEEYSDTVNYIERVKYHVITAQTSTPKRSEVVDSPRLHMTLTDLSSPYWSPKSYWESSPVVSSPLKPPEKDKLLSREAKMTVSVLRRLNSFYEGKKN
ncbi:hypothetical protein RCL1_001756 [Eukaryota sp. TZLM3-RCL]